MRVKATLLCATASRRCHRSSAQVITDPAVIHAHHCLYVMSALIDVLFLRRLCFLLCLRLTDASEGRSETPLPLCTEPCTR
jgi:hypothetical protein